MSACVAVRDRTATNRTDVVLFRLAIAGDREAERELLAKYRAVFLLWVVRRFHNGNRWVDDYAQEAIIRVSENLHKHKPGRSAFCSWAHILAKSAIFTFMSRLATERNDVSLDALVDDAIPALLGPEEEYAYLRVCEEVEKLEYEQWVAIDGRYYQEKTDREIGMDAGLARRKVNYRKEQGLRAIGKGLSEVPFMSIRPRLRFSEYYILVNQRTDAYASAQPGGEEGDFA